MKPKTLVVLGAVALVVIGCILAAGCTSAQDTGSDAKFIGTWTHTTDDDVVVIVMKEGGSGYYMGLAKEPYIRVLKYAPLNWTVNADGTVTHVIEDRVEPIVMTYDEAGDLFNDDHGYTVKRMDPITGIWFREGTDVNTGKSAKMTHVFKNDGTGVVCVVFDDGNATSADVAWKMNDDGTYTLSYPKELTAVCTLDKTGTSATSNLDNDITQKKFTDTYYYLSMLGPWYDSANKCMTFINADGTGITVKENGVAEDSNVFTWEVPEFGKFLLHVRNGATPYGENLAGQDKVAIYDRVNNTFTTHDGTVLVRPLESAGNLTIEKL